MRVFVLEPTEYSMFKIKRFGSLVFLFSDESEHEAWHDQAFLKQVVDRLKQHRFDPAEDAVAASGKMLSVAVMIAAAVRVYGGVRLLCFDHDKEVRDFREVDMSILYPVSCIREGESDESAGP